MSDKTTTDPHPWYLGGCDALGPNGTCAECAKLAPSQNAPAEHRVSARRSRLWASVLCLLLFVCSISGGYVGFAVVTSFILGMCAGLEIFVRWGDHALVEGEKRDA